MRFSWWLMVFVSLPFVMLLVNAALRCWSASIPEPIRNTYVGALGMALTGLHGLGLVYLLANQRPPVPPIDPHAPLQMHAMMCTRCDPFAGCVQRPITAGDVMQAGEWCIGTVMEKEHGI